MSLGPDIKKQLNFAYIVSHHHDPALLMAILRHILGIGHYVTKRHPTLFEQKQMVDEFANHLKTSIEAGIGNLALKEVTPGEIKEFQAAALEAFIKIAEAKKK